MGARVLVCGSRDFTDYEALTNVLDAIHHTRDGIDVIIEGGARGADTFAKAWAENHGVELLEFKADWNKHGKAAGPIRNSQMLTEGRPDIVYAFLPTGVPLSKSIGTADMVNKAKRAGVRTIVKGDDDIDPPLAGMKMKPYRRGTTK